MSLAKFDLQIRVRLSAMHNLIAEDCLYHPTCEEAYFRRLKKQSEAEEVSPHELCLEKIAFELRLGFENLEIYPLQAVWERYSDLLHTMGETPGPYRDNLRRFKAALEAQMPGEFFPPIKSAWTAFNFSPSKSAVEITQVWSESANLARGQFCMVLSEIGC